MMVHGRFRVHSGVCGALARCLALVCAVMTIAAGTAAARSINDGLGTTGFAWLKASSDAEISAAGETMAARGGPSGILVHPAAIADVTSGTVKMSYVDHFVDTQYGTVGYATRRGDRCMGFRMTYVNYGDFVRTDESGTRTGSFSAGDIGFSFNTGKSVRDDLKVGATVSYLTSKIEDYTAQAFTADLGAIYTPPFEGLTVGAVLMNLGKVYHEYSDASVKLPVYLTVGARKKLAHSPFALNADVTFPNDDDPVFAFGLEANLNDRSFSSPGRGAAATSTSRMRRQRPTSRRSAPSAWPSRSINTVSPTHTVPTRNWKPSTR